MIGDWWIHVKQVIHTKHNIEVLEAFVTHGEVVHGIGFNIAVSTALQPDFDRDSQCYSFASTAKSSYRSTMTKRDYASSGK